jgi:hypothetical protein
MIINTGLIDRTLRLLLALVLFQAHGLVKTQDLPAFVDWAIWLMAVYLALSGIFRVCLIYKAAGFDTCARDP